MSDRACDHRDHHGCPPLTEEQIEDIAEKAAEKAIEKLTDHIYQEVGKNVISKLLWLAGALTIGIYIWFQSKGLIK